MNGKVDGWRGRRTTCWRGDCDLRSSIIDWMFARESSIENGHGYGMEWMEESGTVLYLCGVEEIGDLLLL